MATKEKLTLYFPEAVLEELKAEAARQERSMSWIMQRAWMIARQNLKNMPGVEDFGEPLHSKSS